MKILVFNDYCVVGNMALKANISVLSQNGHEVFGLPTKIFSSNMSYKDYISFYMPNFSEIVKKIFEIQKIDAIYIGFIDDEEIFEIIKDILQKFKGKVILDTILGDNGVKYSGTTTEQIDFYRELLKFADVVTPNLTEAMLLTNYNKIFSEIERKDVEKIAKNLLEMGVKRIIIKSFEKNNILNTLCFSENTIKWFESKKIDIKICGTGDVFSSLVTSELVKGEKLENSIQKIQTLLFENIIKQEKQDGLNEIQLENFKIGE
ncbi:PfkB family carbohydrate kinase [Parvimonas micra]|uniref:Putative phosphomethylpyrimidine kinase n=1 Tax=Parvimonas micra ATCC 33270 TaxID=411465 RepID=A8SIU9_9FIRM|nr:PfkB family carbohydrate kinase [Parvimonas micra]EDP24767.1 putative phosphomethylpyrimidine kinase [Parvimonas micra ATCC 33270]MEB3060950.1 PfkB family carbohydrate kinase [Parvimonas micra]MEB3067069.1 PfkB family carbohydrate kinase [Parvimonas micra]RSB91597.1 phosphomethylpyrimidine kinase [Parvimonas micra]VEH96200.1 Pyridoxine kinase [Parvimonas micra]